VQRPNVIEKIKRALYSRYPVIYLVTGEEDRAERALRHVAGSVFNKPLPLATWSLSTGLTSDGKTDEETRAPLAALDRIISSQEPGIFLMKDLHPFLADDRAVARRLRDVYYTLKETHRYVFLLSPVQEIPRELRKEVALVYFDLPRPEELGALVDEMLNRYATSITVDLDEAGRAAVITALQGLTLNEARHAMYRALTGRETIDLDILEVLYEEKEQLTRKEGILEFIPQRWEIHEIGGLDNLKDWLLKREKLFRNPDPAGKELVPRGVLMMGVSGCGKSMAVKSVATLWNLPLFRLDMGQVFSGAWGPPEEAFAQALRTIEAMAPAVLWIDEIEMGLAGYSEGGAGPDARIFASFLTWMQEKPPQIFVAATANRIDLLPAEVTRKGRFDQIFFIDLPSEKEREEIFDCHLRKRNVDPHIFDLTVLAKGTRAWTGAEIEQAVISAMTEAYAEGREVSEDDVFFQIGKIVPLSTSMSEQIKKIRSWAHDRAIKAST